MQITKDQIAATNGNLDHHAADFNYLADKLARQHTDVEAIVQEVADFQVAVPSWALGAGGTRFGRFSFYGEPGNLEQKISDVGILHALTRTADWSLFIEYKPYEPNFYSTVIMDWGTSFMLANACGDRAYTLVDLGHHLPNSNIEQVVATLMAKGKLGGFHFNDSKYGDDDLTVGSIKPYSLFLIFNELVYGMANNPQNPDLAWMIDASHNIKDPLEDLLQSLEAIQEAYAKALLVDQAALETAQLNHDVVKCQEILQGAYRTDVRPLLQRARLQAGGALDPLGAYRSLNVREGLIGERGRFTVATGL